jgi:hypothetical protein
VSGRRKKYEAIETLPFRRGSMNAVLSDQLYWGFGKANDFTAPTASASASTMYE